MALKNLNFDVSINGIMPNIVTDAGTQGDHGVTRLNFMLTEEIYQEVINTVTDGKVMYRFDLYDGEGGLWQSEALALVGRDVGITLQERHTRFGGKLIVYLIITALSSNNKTEVELYNSPIMLKLKNRPNGFLQDGENYESVTSLAENAKQHVLLAAEFAEASKEYNDQTREFVELVEEKLKNGEFDGVGIKNTEIVNGELIITYSNGISHNLGNIMGRDGDSVDLNNYYTKNDIDGFDYADKKYVDQAVANVATDGSVDLGNYYTKTEVDSYNDKVKTQQQAIIKNFENYYTKTDVDTAVSQKQDTLVSEVNIKTINGESILGEGNITIEGGTGESIKVEQTYNPESTDALSGQAVAEALDAYTPLETLDDYYTKDDIAEFNYASVDYVDTEVAKAITNGTVDLLDYVKRQELYEQYPNSDEVWVPFEHPFKVDQTDFAMNDNTTYIGRVKLIITDEDYAQVAFEGVNTSAFEVLDIESPYTYESIVKRGIKRGGIYRVIIENSHIVSVSRWEPLNDYYTKKEVDAKLEDIEAGTVDLGNYYTKTEVDNAIAAVSGGEGGSITVDLSYNATSENAQSGKAVAEAIQTKADADIMPIDIAHFAATIKIMLDDGVYITRLTSLSKNTSASLVAIFEGFSLFSDTLTPETAGDVGLEVGKTYRIVLEGYKLISVECYSSMSDKADKSYVDSLVGDIESLLGGI